MRRVVHLNCASLSGMYKIDHNMAPPFARQGLVACAGLPVPVKCQTVSWYMTGAFGPPLIIHHECLLHTRTVQHVVVVVVVVVAATRTVPSKVYCTFLSYRPRGYPEATRSCHKNMQMAFATPSLPSEASEQRFGRGAAAAPLVLLDATLEPSEPPPAVQLQVPQPTP